MIRRLLPVAAVVAAAAALGSGPRVVHACDQSPCVPVLTAATPEQIELNGKPVHLTLSGANLSGVVAVQFSPVVSGAAFSIFNDSTILVTLPASTQAAVYSVRVVSPDGGSDPSSAPQVELFAAPPPATPTPRAKATPRPTPVPTPAQAQPDTGVVAAAAHAEPTPPAALLQPTAAQPGMSPVSAPIDIMAGLILGAVAYLLWGSPRRLAGSFRSAPALHMLGRPAQALHVGSICLYCGKLHYIWSTRRDLWRAGRYCGPKCFISAEAMPSPLNEEEEPEPEPVLAQKSQAWWKAAVAAVEGPDAGIQSEWKPRY